MNRKGDGEKWIQRGLIDTHPPTHTHPPQTLPSEGLQLPQGDKLSADSDDPESQAVRDKGPGPQRAKDCGRWIQGGQALPMRP